MVSFQIHNAIKKKMQYIKLNLKRHKTNKKRQKTKNKTGTCNVNKTFCILCDDA